MKKALFIFLLSFIFVAHNALALFDVQEEHLHYLNITSTNGTTSADIIYPHNPPNGHSISSIAWTAAPGGSGGDVLLSCKPTATSTTIASQSFETNNNTFGFVETRFYCPYHIYLTCTKACWVGITSWAGDYEHQIGTGYRTEQFGTSTNATSSAQNIIKSNNIENITYQATTTQISPTQQQTIASYYIPNFLFIYVGILILSIFGVLFYAKNKK